MVLRETLDVVVAMVVMLVVVVAMEVLRQSVS
jgi:hypothetical protein